MFTFRPSVRSRAVLIVTVLISLQVENMAWAQKKGSGTTPPPAPGTIYFKGWVPTSGNDGYNRLMSMNGDGTNKTAVSGTEYRSYQQHSGSHWSLGVDVVYNNPTYSIQLFAYPNSGPAVRLTGDPTIQVTDLYVGSLSWAKDDSFVSFPGWWFTGLNATDIRGGLFVVPIDWSTGVPVAGPPQKIFEAKAYLFEASGVFYPEWTANINIVTHDWAVGGNAVVYEKEADGESPAGIYIADVSGESATIRPLTVGYAPQWSPDGSRIAFANNSRIWAINPDGSNVKQITQATTTKSQASPTWSPDGAFLAYTEMSTAKGKTTWSIMRINLATGSIFNLTSDLLKATSPAWR